MDHIYKIYKIDDFFIYFTMGVPHMRMIMGVYDRKHLV